ncbi:hypothetical protein [Nocardia sp. NPDC004722]
MLPAAKPENNRVTAGEIGRLAIGFTGSATYELPPALTRVRFFAVVSPKRPPSG